MKLFTCVVVVFAALVACGGCSSSCCNVSADVPSAGFDITKRVSLDFPATYSGILPCSDCEGTRYTLNIWSDQVFFRRMTHLGNGEGEGTGFDDIGHWSFSADGAALIFSSKDETPEVFAIEGREMLRKLDIDGNPIESELNCTLVRQKKMDWFEPHVRLHGMYSYVADAGVFTECLSRLNIPVAPEAGNAALERSYSFARGETGEPLLVSLEGRIINRSKADGVGKVQVLVVEKFLNLWPGESCWPEVKVAARSCGR